MLPRQKISKKKKTHHTSPSSNELQAPPNSPKLLKKNASKKIIGRIIVLITLAASVASIVSICYAFKPKISIVANPPIDPEDPFSATFFVRNDSILSIYDVRFLRYITKAKAKGSDITISTLCLGSWPAKPISMMKPGETTTVLFTSAIYLGTPITSGNVVIRVFYSPSFLPGVKLPWTTKEEDFRFTTGKDTNGKLIWYPAAESEDNPIRP